VPGSYGIQQQKHIHRILKKDHPPHIKKKNRPEIIDTLKGCFWGGGDWGLRLKGKRKGKNGARESTGLQTCPLKLNRQQTWVEKGILKEGLH